MHMHDMGSGVADRRHLFKLVGMPNRSGGCKQQGTLEL